MSDLCRCRLRFSCVSYDDNAFIFYNNKNDKNNNKQSTHETLIKIVK